MATGWGLVMHADTKIGYRYATGPTRTTGQNGYYDCSGFSYAMVQDVGGPRDFPTSSSTQARYCRDHGTLISEQQAIHTPGALAFRGYNHGYDGFGPNGHVVIMRGDGATTDEAMGHRWGVCHGHVYGRGFSNWALVPGIAYGSNVPPPKPPPPAQVQHETRDKMEIFRVDPADPDVRTKSAYASLDAKDGKLIGHHAVKVKWNDRNSADAPWIGSKEPYFIDIPINKPIEGGCTVAKKPGETVFMIMFLDGTEIVGYAREK